MALTIKGIEAAKPRLDKKSGTLKPVRLSDGNGLYLDVTETSKRWRARYTFKGKEQMLSLGKYPVETFLSTQLTSLNTIEILNA